MLYPKEDKENKLLLYAVSAILTNCNYVRIYKMYLLISYSVEIVIIHNQLRTAVYMSTRLRMKSSM